jgi:hypothetical protein
MFLLNHPDAIKMLSEAYQRRYAEVEADHWRGKIVMGLPVLAKQLEDGDSVYPQYNCEDRAVQTYIFACPLELGKVATMLPEIEGIKHGTDLASWMDMSCISEHLEYLSQNQ